MKRLLIFLLLPFTLLAGRDYTLHAPHVPEVRIEEAEPIQVVPVIFAQTNTFCAANLACTVTAVWTFSNNLTVSGTGTFTGAVTAKQLNNVVAVDGVSITTAQACVTAAAALPGGPGTCYVPTGTAFPAPPPNASCTGFAAPAQVCMVSGVSLVFGPGTFTNLSTTGGDFIVFPTGISGASLSGQGVDTTILKNNPTGTQFGAVIQDEAGIDNTYALLTANGNGNTTSSLITHNTTRSHLHNLKLIHDLTTNSLRNYAWHIRGETDIDGYDIITIGGALDGVFFDGTFGGGSPLTGGQLTYLNTSQSPYNGWDLTCGTGGNISRLKFVNVQSTGNGTNQGADGHHDDQYGFSMFDNGTACTVSEMSFDNAQLTGNKGAGIRLKGNVQSSIFKGIICDGNGSTTDTGPSKDCITMNTSTGTQAPVGNYLQGVSRKGSATNALNTDANTTLNKFELNVGGDPISLGNTNDVLSLVTTVGGNSFISAIRFDQQSLAACPSAPGIANVSGTGICIASGTTKFTGANQLVEIAAPGSGIGGSALCYADSTQHTILCSMNNGPFTPIAGTFTKVNVTPVTANANVTTDQNGMAITVTAGALNSVSRTLLVQLAGVYSTAAASTAVITDKIKLCTVSGCGSGTVITLATWTTSALGGVTVTNNPYNATVNVSTQTAGATAAFESHGNLVIDLAALAAASESIFADNNTATIGTIDSTAQLFLQHTRAFSAASASNSFTDRQMIADTVD